MLGSVTPVPTGFFGAGLLLLCAQELTASRQIKAAAFIGSSNVWTPALAFV
jgi:hypothetical protein